MLRRQFLGVMAGTLAAGTLGGCASRPRERDAAAAQPKPILPTDVATWTAARRFVELPIGKIAYVERGTGDAAPALFLHGLPLNGYQWRGAVDRLSAHRRCIAPDFMGLGFSQVATHQSVTPASQVAMLAAFLDALGVSKFDMVASDSGGAVAQLFTVRYPARVRTLLLTNCDTEPDSPPPKVVPAIEAARAGNFPDTWLKPSLLDKSFARGPQGLGGATFTFPSRLADETLDCYLGPLVSSPERKALVNAYLLGLDPNPLAGLEAALKKCALPARIIWGTGDDIFAQTSADYLARTLPGARGVRRVAGAKLFFPEEYPDIIAEEARQLWGIGAT